MSNTFSHLIDLNDYPVSWWDKIINLGEKIYKNPDDYRASCSSKIMGTLFYEPSTRTQMSFQSAMIRLGGSVIGFDNPSTTSVAKGENLKDTTKVVSSYSDIVVIRHPLEGSAKAAALTADCPVVNAGDGGHLHPTQTLTDLLTLKLEKGTLENLTIGLCGDLMNGRTVHSLVKAMSFYKGNKFVLISTKELTLPAYLKALLHAANCEISEVNTIEEAIGSLDVLYMTRIQKERFASEEEYLLQKDVFVLDRHKLLGAKSDLKIMHPLPRVDEISIDVDSDERAIYFKQAKYGVYARMALILTIINNGCEVKLLEGQEKQYLSCTNKKCITNTEHYLKKSYTGKGDTVTCDYCSELILLDD